MEHDHHEKLGITKFKNLAGSNNIARYCSVAILFVGLTDHMKPPSFTPRTKKGKKVDAKLESASSDR